MKWNEMKWNEMKMKWNKFINQTRAPWVVFIVGQQDATYIACDYVTNYLFFNLPTELNTMYHFYSDYK
jgi:hypothetical protein